MGFNEPFAGPGTHPWYFALWNFILVSGSIFRTSFVFVNKITTSPPPPPLLWFVNHHKEGGEVMDNELTRLS